MRGSQKGDEPEALQAWKACQDAACIEPRYPDLRGAEKRATRHALFIEQTGQCVYCGRGIELEPGSDRHHIEHFRPRGRNYRHLELAYRNLFLSCGPKREDGGTQPTCGNKKDSWFDESCHVEPSPEGDCQQRFEFASGGGILGDGSPEADRMITILNLNHRELVAERMALIEELDEELNEGLPYCDLIESFLHVSQNGSRVSFANVAVQYLRRQHAVVHRAVPPDNAVS
ncbi:MAG: TIGR02646 family protein [Boseongicola sp.]|nr:TIGR02646 family protein [Boseongicola sp.]